MKAPAWAVRAANRTPIAVYDRKTKGFVMNDIEVILQKLVALQVRAYERGKKEGWASGYDSARMVQTEMEKAKLEEAMALARIK